MTQSRCNHASARARQFPKLTQPKRLQVFDLGFTVPDFNSIIQDLINQERGPREHNCHCQEQTSKRARRRRIAPTWRARPEGHVPSPSTRWRTAPTPLPSARGDPDELSLSGYFGTSPLEGQSSVFLKWMQLEVQGRKRGRGDGIRRTAASSSAHRRLPSIVHYCLALPFWHLPKDISFLIR